MDNHTNPHIDEEGNKYWYDYDVQAGGAVFLHREEGPARELIDGSKEWYKDGVLHREDGAASIIADGRKRWFVKGTRVR